MSTVNLGLFETPSGGKNYGYWDTETGEVLVGTENAGTASTEKEARTKADFYATTRQKMK